MNTARDRTSEPTKPPRRRNRLGTEAAFVTAAAEIFAERGFENATTKAIAERAGYSEGLIQTYFKGKEGLLIAVMARELDGGEAEAAFFSRPLCATIEDEVLETLTYVSRSLAPRSTRLRIVLSRVFIDPQFKTEYGRNTYRKVFETGLNDRLGRYSMAGLLGAGIDPAMLCEMLICLSFELGFIHPHVLDTPAATVESLAPAFASIIGRAFPTSIP